MLPFGMIQDPMSEAEVRESFDRQGFNANLGAALTYIAPGEVHVGVNYAPHLTQQNGFLHAGVIASIADNACGYAAMSAAPTGHNPLAVEFKVNLLAPARGERFEARARVLRRGRTLSVIRADVFAIEGAREEMIATMLETAILRPVPDHVRGE
jgi:uncharacterized protein (TIGR00369 family)